MVSAERRLGDVVRVHAHLMIARAQVELGEEARAMQLVQELIHNGNGELVLGRDGVEGAEVDAETPRAVGLAHKEHGGAER